MAKRLICCPLNKEDGMVLRYLYVDTSKLLVQNVTNEISSIFQSAEKECCFDTLLEYAQGEKPLNDEMKESLSFKLSELNSFELFKTSEELKLKTGSEKILKSCMLNYYRREYDGTQQYAFFSAPSVSNIFVSGRDGVEHELTLENRELIKDAQAEEGELETLDKGKTDAEREAEAAQAQAQAELEAEMAKAEKDAEKQNKRKSRRKAEARRAEEEYYRELRNQDDVKSEEYRRIRQYEEEMRLNNDYLTSQYQNENYQSLPGYIPADTYASSYESINNETMAFAFADEDLYRVASRFHEFGVDYTIVGDTLNDGSHCSVVCFTTDYANAGTQALEFYELEKRLYNEKIANDKVFYNAFQLSALDYAYENNIDTSFVSSGDYNGNQMYRILDAGLNGQDMSVLANPAYTPAHMDALSYYVRNNWDTAAISDPTTPLNSIADNIMRNEFDNGISKNDSFFEQRNYDSFVSYRDNSVTSFSNDYDASYRKELFVKTEAANLAAKENYKDFKENIHRSYEISQKEMNYVADGSNDTKHSPSNANNYSFGGGYTPNGYYRDDSSFVANSGRKNDYSPTSRPATGDTSRPNKTPVSEKPFNKKYPLDDLKIRSDFARTVGLQIQNHGSQFLHFTKSSFGSSIRQIAYKMGQNDESGAYSSLSKTKRIGGGIIYTAQLISDTPRAFARVGQGISYTSNAIANINRLAHGKETITKTYKPLTANAVVKEMKTLQANHFDSLKKEFGSKAAKMNIKEINSNIHRFEIEKKGFIDANRKLKAEIKSLDPNHYLKGERNSLINSNKQLKKDIQALKLKKNPTAADKELLASKLLQKQNNEKLIAQKTAIMKQQKPNAATQKLIDTKLKQKSANEALIKAKAKSIKDLKNLKLKNLDFEKAMKALKAKHKSLAKAAGRWKHLPGRLIQSFVSQLNKAGNDVTMEGLATASNYAMSIARNPLVRIAGGVYKKIVVKPAKKLVKKGAKKVYNKAKTHIKNRSQRKIKKRVSKKIGVKKRLKKKAGQAVKKSARNVKNTVKGIKNGIKGVINGAKATLQSIKATWNAIVSAAKTVFHAVASVVTNPIFWIVVGVIAAIFLIAYFGIMISNAISSSFILTDSQTEDGRIDLSGYVEIVNEEQLKFSSSITDKINNIGSKYDNIYYDTSGEIDNNTKQILAMMYVRFGGDLTNGSATNGYIQQLFNDSNYFDIIESDYYSCSTGCTDRSYLCTDKISGLSPAATTTRKSRYESAKNRGGCMYSAAYSCTEKAVIFKHNDGEAMFTPCSCDNCKDKLMPVQTGILYYCKGHENKNGSVYYHPNTTNSENRCSNSEASPLIENKTVYYCQGYSGKIYNKNGCVKHNDGKAMDKPCDCGNYKRETETITVTLENGDKEEQKVSKYYCQGYCPGNHHDWTCPGHTEKVCYGKHKDATITVSSLGFDKIFAADSSFASLVRGEAYEGAFKITAYCSCHECCHPYDPACTGKPSETAWGTTPKANHTIAVDPKVIPLGSSVFIDGREYVAEDTGGAIKGKHIDMYFDSHQEALEWGEQYKTVYRPKAITSNTGVDEYGFDGWTEDNIELCKQIYNGLSGAEAKEIYAGLENITDISYGTQNNSNFDFDNIVFDNSSGLTKKQQQIVAAVKNNKLPTKKGYCQAWVADTYQSVLGIRGHACCAAHAGEQWGVSSDWSKIQVGATVYGYNNGVYGHVGIYIGDGKVAHNIGYIKIDTLKYWVNRYDGRCWGWENGQNLTGNSKYNCQPKGTFMKGKH